MGCSLGADKRHSHPADILVQNWIIGKPAAFDLRKPHRLIPLFSLKQELQCTSGSAAMAAGVRKHLVNDPKCSELGWVSIP